VVLVLLQAQVKLVVLAEAVEDNLAQAMLVVLAQQIKVMQAAQARLLLTLAQVQVAVLVQ
jgi:hypothetical protein